MKGRIRDASFSQLVVSSSILALLGIVGLQFLTSNNTSSSHSQPDHFLYSLMDSLDFGDLPFPYQTNLAADGPRHRVKEVPEIFLGSRVDGEPDGTNSDLAIQDDEDQVDDEDGITLVTPLIPGSEACIEMTFTAPRDFGGPDGFLLGWIDYNGNGAFEGQEQIIFTKVNGEPADLELETDALILENGYKKNSDTVSLCFEVPPGATFFNGNAAMRFRISTNPLMGPNGVLIDNTVPDGEVEDYLLPLSKIGGIVWEDFNFNGLQEVTEAGTGLNNLTVALVYAGEDEQLSTTDYLFPLGDDRVYLTETQQLDGVDGLYYFFGLIEGTKYRIITTIDGDLSSSPMNIGDNDQLDSDGQPIELNSNYYFIDFSVEDVQGQPLAEAGLGDDHGGAPALVAGFPDEQVNQTYDFGVGALDFGDLPDLPDLENDFRTLRRSSGPVHLIYPGSFLGTCVDPEINGQASEKAVGDDKDLLSDNIICEDDENGVELITPIIVGNEACIRVQWSWTLSDTAYLHAWMDFNGNGQMEGQEKLIFNLEAGVDTKAPLLKGDAQRIDLCFNVPANTQLKGEIAARFRLSDRKGLAAFGPVIDNQTQLPFGEVEDYIFPLAHIGNLVWLDKNLNGIQDTLNDGMSESGLAGAKLQLTFAGYEKDEFQGLEQVSFFTTSDETGRYSFDGLIPGRYILQLSDFETCTEESESLTKQYVLTVPAQGEGPDAFQFDSNGSPADTFDIDFPVNLPINEMGLNDQQGACADSLEDLTLDFGLVEKPKIEAILNDVGYDYPESGTCGNFNVLLDLCIKNTGGTALNSISSLLNLEQNFGSAFVGLAAVSILNAEEVQQAPGLNTLYAGTAEDFELFEPESGQLNPGDSLCVRIVVEIDPDASAAPDPLTVQAEVWAKAINFGGMAIPDYCNELPQILVEDASNDSMEMEGTMQTQANPTILSDCWKSVDLIAQNSTVFVTVDENCQITVTADMLIENHKPACGDEAFPEGGFYRVRYNDIENLGAITIDVDDYNVGEPLVFQVRTITNFCFPVQGFVIPVDNTVATVPPVTGEAELICTDIDSIRKYFKADIARANDECRFEGVSWDILREQGVFNVDHLDDGCFGLCQLDIQVSDIFLPGNECTGSTMIRTIRIKDELGNVETVEVPFNFKPFDLQLDRVGEDTLVDLCIYPDASSNELLLITGTPYYINGFGDTVNIDQRFFDNQNTAFLCGHNLAFEDQILNEDCGQKLIRTWTILNQCKTSEPTVVEQIIRMGQLSPPEVTCPESFKDTISSGPFDCTASFVVPPPTVNGCANDSFEYSIKIFEVAIKRDVTGLPISGEFDTTLVAAEIEFDEVSNSYKVSQLEHGSYFVGYNVVDKCGNVAQELRCPFEVIDRTEPVAKCQDQLNISVDGTGTAQIAVVDIDAGSWDNCELAEVRIRRTLDSCLDEYLFNVLDLESLDELGSSTQYNPMTGDSTLLFFTTTGRRDTFIMAEVGPDSIFHYYTYWSDQVFFTCCDISKTPEDLLKIELQARDVAGNANICWSAELIENKITPFCDAPDDITIECVDLVIDPTNLEEVRNEFGTVEELLESGDLSVDFNCGFTVFDTIEWRGTDCLEGQLKRIFNIVAVNGLTSTCEQLISVENLNDYVIVFPADYRDVCGGDGGELIETNSFACDIFAINTDTAIFEGVDEICFRRHITYQVINWCEYDGTTLEPTVIARDFDCDGDTEEKTYLKVFKGNVWLDDDSSIARPGIINDASDIDSTDNDESELISWTFIDDSFILECKEDTFDYTLGFWEYKQVVDVIDNQPPIVMIDTLIFCSGGIEGLDDCEGAYEIPFTAFDSCTQDVEIRRARFDLNATGSPVDLTDIWYAIDTISGGFIIKNVEGKGVPEGEHIFEVTVADLCGNIAIREIPFTVVDCKTPAPVCIELFSIDLLPIVFDKQIVGGENFIDAYTFIGQDIFDCTPHPDPDGAGDVKYYVVRADELALVGLESPTADYLSEDYRKVRFDCDDEGKAIKVYVIAVDGAGNFDFCTVQVSVIVGLDPNPCGEVVDVQGTISGRIATFDDQVIENVEVTLNGQVSASFITGADGRFSFSELIEAYDYTITPLLDTDPMNGVSTFDLVIITKAILGIESFSDPYTMIAADVNRSGSITTLDLIQLRKMVLSVDDQFSNNTSWRFVDASYDLSGEQSFSGDLPEFININNLSGFTTADFIGIKIGDVNHSRSANRSDNSIRTAGNSIAIDATDRYLKKGEIFELTLSSQDLNQLLGLQFSLAFDPDQLQLDDISYGLVKRNHTGLAHVKDGVITVSWNTAAGRLTRFDSDQLLTLKFAAIADVHLAEAVDINSRYTQSEAYDGSGNLLNINLSWSNTAAKDNMIVDQNIPNPFHDQTVIPFYLPEQAQVDFQLMNSNGQLVHQITREYSAGSNEIRLIRRNWAPGIYTYQIKAEEQLVVKRMIIVD